MGRRRRRSGLQSGSPGDKRDSETAALINDLLQQDPVDVTQLRKLVAVRGIPSAGLRSRVWPLLLGLAPSPFLPGPLDDTLPSAAEERDASVIACDIDRSLWAFTKGWSEEARSARRAALRRVLLRALRAGPGVWYYQGLHDVAAVLLFSLGEAAAGAVLAHLGRTHLRDATRRDLLPATQTLALLYPLLRAADPALHAHLISLGEPALEVPFFALSWHLTWFAHDVGDLAQICRLFDLFLASHPLMPLYLAAVAVKSNREAVLACGGDGPAAYAALKGMKVLREDGPGADQLAREAAALYRAVPPSSLSHLDLGKTVAPDAFLSNGVWSVPDAPLEKPGMSAAKATVLRLRASVFPPPNASPRSSRSRRVQMVAVFSSLTGLAAVGAAILLTQGLNPSSR